MCSQADDPSQHVSDDTLRAALPRTDAGRRLLGREAYNSRSFAIIRAEDIIAIEDEAAALAASATDEGTLRMALKELADEAARAVTEPRRFHENEDDRQQKLGRLVSRARALAASATAEPWTDPKG